MTRTATLATNADSEIAGRPAGEVSPRRRSDLVRAAGIFLVVFSLYFVSYSRLLPDAADEMLYFAVTESIAKGQGVAIDQVSTVGPAPEEFGVGGHRYSKKAPLTSLLAVPLFLLAQRLPIGAVDTVLLLNHIVGALIAALFFLLVRSLGYSGRLALFLAAVVAFGTPLWVYAKSLMPESTIALGIVATVYAAYQSTRTRRIGWVVACGAGYGAAVAAKNVDILLLAPVPVYIGWSAMRHARRMAPAHDSTFATGAQPLLPYWRKTLGPPARDLGCFALGAAPFAALLIAYSYLRYGTLSSGYGDWETFSTPIWEGIAGILFSPGKSLFIYTPLFFLLPFWAISFLRRWSSFGLLISAIVVLHLLIYGSWFVWWGGWTWASRFTVPILPLLVLMLVEGLASQRRPLTVALVPLLTAASFAIQVLGIAVHGDVYLFQLMAQFPRPDLATIWDFSRSPILNQIPLMTHRWLDFAWVDALGPSPVNVPALAYAALGSAVAMGFLVVVWRSGRRVGLVGLALSALVVAGVTLQALRIYYRHAAPEVVSLAAALEEAPANAAVLQMIPKAVVPYANRQKRPLLELGWIEEPQPDPIVIRRLQEVIAFAPEIWVATDTPAKAPGNGIEATLSRSLMQVRGESIGPFRLLRFITRPSDVPFVETSYAFANGIGLAGFTVDRVDSKAGQTLHLTLKWQASSAMSRSDYTVFVHVVRSGGTLVAQHDGPPAGGYAPASGWLPGQVVYDYHRVAMPADASAAPLSVRVGLYQPANGQRAPLVAPGNGDFVTLDVAR